MVCDAAGVVWTWVRRVGLLLVTVVVLEYAAVHLLAGARASWSSVTTAAPPLLLSALAAEVASLACFSVLTLVLLPRASGVSYPTLFACDLTGYGLSHVVPGGGATATALRFRLLARAGIPTEQAVSVAAVQSAVAVFWLVTAFLVGLVAAVPTSDTRPFVQTAAVLAAVLVVAFGGVIAVLVARPDQVVGVTHAAAARLPFVRADALERLVRSLVGQVQLLMSSGVRTGRVVVWAFANWFLDATCLFLSIRAFGVTPHLGGLLSTYALVALLALLPVTPGGLGLVEGVAVPALVSFGTPHGAALLGVLTWRLFQFWLPIPSALATYLWLRLRFRDSPYSSSP